MDLLRPATAILLSGHIGGLFAQTFYDRIYGGFVNDWAHDIAIMEDSTFVIGGMSSSFVVPGNVADPYLIKCSRDGHVMWSTHYDVSNTAYVHDIVAAPGNRILIGGSNNNIGGWLLMCDAQGTVLWGRYSSSVREFRTLAIAPDSAIYMGGQTTGSDVNACIFKLNWTGNPLWSRTFGTGYEDRLTALAATSDGGVIITGSTLVGGPVQDATLLKLDALGNVQWSRTYGIPGAGEAFKDVIECQAGGYLAVGDGISVNGRPFLCRTDANGDTLWMRRYDGYEALVSTVVETGAGFIVSGEHHSSQYYPYLFKVNNAGDPLWGMWYTSTDLVSDPGEAVEMGDGRLAVVGNQNGIGPGATGPRLLVVDSAGQGNYCSGEPISWPILSTAWQLGTYGSLLPEPVSQAWSTPAISCVTLEDSTCVTSIGMPTVPAHEQLHLFPNPTTGLVTLAGVDQEADCSITDAMGKAITPPSNLNGDGMVLDLGAFAPGLYQMRVARSGLAPKGLRLVVQR